MRDSEDELGADTDGIVLITVHHADEVLPNDKIPEIKDGEAVPVSTAPDGPFRLLATANDWTRAMQSLSMEEDQ